MLLQDRQELSVQERSNHAKGKLGSKSASQ
jgi:hypothetical protein